MKSLQWFLTFLLVAVWAVSARPLSGGPRNNQRGAGEAASQRTSITIPGPLRSFERMAAISQKVSSDEIMPLLARNSFLHGYSGQGARLRPTEYLVLLRRYVQQAEELSALAGLDEIIRVSGCGDADRVLKVLGYRTRPDCGQKNTYIETADQQRAFLTTDSGFPLPELEKTLQGGPAFTYVYPKSEVPILLTEGDWLAVYNRARKGSGDASGLLDAILFDPTLARLYAAWSRMDPETLAFLKKAPGLDKLAPLAASLDYYGAYIQIRSGRVVVPGGAHAEAQWKELVGASPDSPAQFVQRLLAKDNGWLGAYFDSMARTTAEQQAHFAESNRLQLCYDALRGKQGRHSPSATASVFRPNPDLVFLTTRLQWGANGEPHVPGGLQAWKHILMRKTSTETARSWDLGVRGSDDADALLESMFAFSRVPTEDGPTDIYLTLSELDRRRPPDRLLGAQTAELMADKFSEFSDQYLMFSEFPELTDASIALFLNTASALGKISDHPLRGNAMGMFQANVGIWEILARQGQIPAADLDSSWQRVIKPYAQVTSASQLFALGRKSLNELSLAATGNASANENELIDLVAGPSQTIPGGAQMHVQVANRVRAVLDDQRLVSLDTLFALSDDMDAISKGAPSTKEMVRLADQLREFQMPRPIFSSGERADWAAGVYDNRHTELQMRTSLPEILAAASPGQNLEEARGQLVPFLRDTLVGLNYAYYEPPGSQALHNNPLLVRSHDFSGDSLLGLDRELWEDSRVIGTGSPAGGGAHLVGSLAGLPYVLGRMEEDFLSPENVQALIWGDLVPGVIANAVMPRWWNVTPNELHAVALYQRAGEELVAASATDERVRGRVIAILSTRMSPQKASRLASALRGGHVEDSSSELTPADFFYLTAEYRQNFAQDANPWGAAGRELAALSREYPAEVSLERLSRDFGVPHPILERTYARALLDTPPLPTFEGYSSKLLAETWDSPNLYWARLADEMGYSPVELNRLVPMLTRRMIVKIFATELDDSPAILRAMRETGEEFRHGRLAALPGNGSSAEAPAATFQNEKVN